MNKKKVLITALVVFAVLTGIYAFISNNATGAEYITVPGAEDGRGILAVGKIRSSSGSELTAEISGRILKSPIKEGAAVAIGETIFVIDSSSHDQVLAQAKADYDKAAAQYENLLQSQLPNAKQSMLKAESEKNSAEDSYNDAIVLFDAGAMSQTGLDNARLDYESAAAEYNAAKREYQSLAAGGTLNRQYLASLEASKAGYENALEQNAKYMITSPQEGTLLKKNVEQGDYVQPGENMAYVGDLQDLYISAELDERYFPYIKAGMSAFAFISESEKYKAAVSTVSPYIDQDTGSFSIKLAIDSDFPLRASELTISIEIPPENGGAVFPLPASYILNDGNESYVWKYDAGRIHRAAIVEGPSYPGQATAASGIEEGDILVRPEPDFSDGDKISLKK